MEQNQKLDLILEKLSGMDRRLEAVESRLEAVESRLEAVESRLETLEGEVAGLHQEITLVKIQMENELSVNIRRVAEGHLDLARNLQEATKHSAEFEMMAVRLNTIERVVQSINIRQQSQPASA